MKMIMEGMRFCMTPLNFSLNEVTFTRTFLKIQKVEQQTCAKRISLTCMYANAFFHFSIVGIIRRLRRQATAEAYKVCKLCVFQEVTSYFRVSRELFSIILAIKFCSIFNHNISISPSLV